MERTGNVPGQTSSGSEGYRRWKFANSVRAQCIAEYGERCGLRGVSAPGVSSSLCKNGGMLKQ